MEAFEVNDYVTLTDDSTLLQNEAENSDLFLDATPGQSGRIVKIDMPSRAALVHTPGGKKHWVPLNALQKEAPKCGYDVCTFTREWLKTKGHATHSLCETVLLDDQFIDLRGNIDIADTFFSHMQKEQLVGEGHDKIFTVLKDAEHEQFEGRQRTWWVDYFAL